MAARMKPATGPKPPYTAEVRATYEGMAGLNSEIEGLESDIALFTAQRDEMQTRLYAIQRRMRTGWTPVLQDRAEWACQRIEQLESQIAKLTAERDAKQVGLYRLMDQLRETNEEHEARIDGQRLPACLAYTRRETEYRELVAQA
jgi:predicted  nucleic acid-binding Zn-ribbon protein